MTTITIQNLLLLTQHDLNELSIFQEEVYNLMKELRILPHATQACLGVDRLHSTQIIKILQIFANKVDSSKSLRSQATYYYQGNPYQLLMISIHGIDAYAQISEPRLTFGYNQASDTFILTSYHASDHTIERHVKAHETGWNKITSEITDEIPEKTEQHLATIDLSSITVEEVVSQSIERSDLDARAEKLITELKENDPEKTEDLCKELKTVSKRLAGRKNRPATLEFLNTAMNFLITKKLVEKERATVNSVIRMMPLMLAIGDSLDFNDMDEFLQRLNPVLISKLQDPACVSFTLKACTELFSVGLLCKDVFFYAIEKLGANFEQMAQWILSDAFISLPCNPQVKILQSFFEVAASQPKEVVFSKEVSSATIEGCRLLPSLNLNPSMECVDAFIRIPVDIKNLKYHVIATYLLNNINEPALQAKLLNRIVTSEMKPLEATLLIDNVLDQNLALFLKLFCKTIEPKFDVTTNLNNLLLFVKVLNKRQIDETQRASIIDEFFNQVVKFLNNSSPDNHAKEFLVNLETLFDFVLNHLDTPEQLINFFDAIKAKNKRNINVLTLPENICKKIIDKVCAFIDEGKIGYYKFLGQSNLLIDISNNSIKVYDYFIAKTKKYQPREKQEALTKAYQNPHRSMSGFIESCKNQMNNALETIEKIEQSGKRRAETKRLSSNTSVISFFKPTPLFFRISTLSHTRGDMLTILRSMRNHMNRIPLSKREKQEAMCFINKYEDEQIKILSEYESKYSNMIEQGFKDKKCSCEEKDEFITGIILLYWYLMMKEEKEHLKNLYHDKLQYYGQIISLTKISNDPTLSKIIKTGADDMLTQLERQFGVKLQLQENENGEVCFVSPGSRLR